MTENLRSALAGIATAIGRLDEMDREALVIALSETASLSQSGIEDETLYGLLNYLETARGIPETETGGAMQPPQGTGTGEGK